MREGPVEASSAKDPEAEPSQIRRRQHAHPNAICGGARRRGGGPRHVHKAMVRKPGRASRPAEKARGSKVATRADKAKRGEDERLTDGPVVAMKRGNARGAKGPCRRHSEGE